MEEVWKTVIDFPDYEVSSHGRVRSNKQGRTRILKQAKAMGYLVITLYAPEKRFLKKVHRLVLENFVGKCSAGIEGSHLDGNTENNHLENLVWESPAKNSRRRSIAKLNYLMVSWIRLLLERGWKNNKLANEFNVTRSTISDINKNRTWKGCE